MTSYDAVVVGSGPNGLAAAITLLNAGACVLVLEAKDTPGGGMRTAELTLPGFRHDVCSAIHPMAAAGSFFSENSIDVTWLQPDVTVAHPLDDGTAGVLHRSVERTAEANDAPRWTTLFRPIVANWEQIDRDILGPTLRVPAHPITLATLGVRALPSATAVARWLRSPRAGALFSGVAAHTNTNLSWPMSSSAGIGLIAAGHVAGWPCAAGGSQTIAEAMVARVVELGGEISCGTPVRTLADLPPASSYLFDTTPWQLASIATDQIPSNVRRAWRRFRPGNGVFTLDYALSEPMQWTNADARLAGPVH
ncbi:MAG: phytoene desaturase family protein, partial [Actinomycetes bacterium]